MRKRIRRLGLMVLAMLPIAAVAFAAQSALSIAQIGRAGVSNSDLVRSGADSRGG